MVSCLHDVKGGRSNAGIIIVSTAVIGLLFLPLAAFAQQQQGGDVLGNITWGLEGLFGGR